MLWDNQEGVCALCEQPMNGMNDGTIDHIIPLSKGGSKSYSNKQIVHRVCNEKKGNQDNDTAKMMLKVYAPEIKKDKPNIDKAVLALFKWGFSVEECDTLLKIKNSEDRLRQFVR